MKENLQSLLNGSKRFPSFILSRMNTGKAIGVLLLAVIAIAFSLSNPQRTSSAVVKNSENGFLPLPEQTPTPACENLEPSGSCNTETNGDTGCPFKSESCQLFDNPCDGFPPILAFVTTTLLIHTHVDSSGGQHFRSHLEIHGKTPTAGQCTNTGLGSASPGGNRFAFVKASTSQVGDIVIIVKNSGFYASGPPPETFSDPFDIRIITTGVGGGPNFTSHSTLHTTENANGEFTACVTHERLSCPPTPTPTPPPPGQ